MTIADLIKELRKFPSTSRVLIQSERSEYGPNDIELIYVDEKGEVNFYDPGSVVIAGG